MSLSELAEKIGYMHHGQLADLNKKNFRSSLIEQLKYTVFRF